MLSGPDQRSELIMLDGNNGSKFPYSFQGIGYTVRVFWSLGAR